MVDTPLDIDFVRGNFPGLQNGWTFFDNAGGTQILEGVVARIQDYLINRNVQIGGSYEVSRKSAAALHEGRAAMAQLVNARQAEEIVFASSSTVALQNLARSMGLGPGDEVIVTLTDHESNIGPWVNLSKLGVEVKWWSIDNGTLELDLTELDSLLSPKTRLVAVTHVSNILGTVNPIRDIADVVHRHGALLCVDSVAYAPHRALDVQSLDVDFLVFSLYKTFGPHFAVLYGKYGELRKLAGLYHYFYGKDRVPEKLEPGNANYELAFGAAGVTEYLIALGRHHGKVDDERAALELAWHLITEHEAKLAERLLDFLREHADCTIIGRPNGDVARVPTISFKVAGRDAARLAGEIDKHHIAVRHGDFHARRLVEHLGLEKNGGVIRVSMAHYNTLDEVDRLVDAFRQTLG